MTYGLATATLAALGGAALLSAWLLAHHLQAQADRDLEKFRDVPLSAPAAPRAESDHMDPDYVVLLLDPRGRVVGRRTGSPTCPTSPGSRRTGWARTPPARTR